MRVQNNYVDNTYTGKSKETKDKFYEQVGAFEEKVRDRLENGEPTYTMGRTSMTQTDWESLMDNVDSYIEKARKLNEVQKQKNLEESLEEKVYNKIMLLTKDK